MAYKSRFLLKKLFDKKKIPYNTRTTKAEMLDMGRKKWGDKFEKWATKKAKVKKSKRGVGAPETYPGGYKAHHAEKKVVRETVYKAKDKGRIPKETRSKDITVGGRFGSSSNLKDLAQKTGLKFLGKWMAAMRPETRIGLTAAASGTGFFLGGKAGWASGYPRGWVSGYHTGEEKYKVQRMRAKERKLYGKKKAQAQYKRYKFQLVNQQLRGNR